jgi:nucleoside-triphosphatase
MELFSAAFYPAVVAVLDSGVAVLGTLPLPRYGRTIPQVGGGCVGCCWT